MVDKELTADRMAIFWHRADDSIVSLFDSLGIFRILKRRNYGREWVIFEVGTDEVGREFAANIGEGYLCIDYVEAGRLNSHRHMDSTGKWLMSIHDIELSEQWINRLATYEYSAHIIKMYVSVRCTIAWNELEARQYVEPFEQSHS